MRQQMPLKVFLVSLCLLAGTVSIVGAEQQTNSISPEPAPVGIEQQTNGISSAPATTVAVATVTPTPPSEGLVSMDFQDAEIKNVLKVLAYKSNMNIVAGPEVTGAVTIQLNDVPWQKALEVVLATYGYGYERKGNIITVTTIENLKKRHEDAQLLSNQEPLITKTYTLSFSKASDVVDSINKMKTNRGQINFDQRTNTLIIRDLQSNMDLIEDVLKTLDAPTPQVLIEAKIIETTFTNDQRLGVDWKLKFNTSGARRPITFPFHRTSSNKFLPDPIPPDDVGSGTSSGIKTGATDFSYGTLDASGLSAALEILNSQSDSNILSNPKIITLDNQTAKIVVGYKYPLPDYTYNQEQAKLQVSGWNYLDIGIIFEVTPHVNNARLVTLDLNPRITAIADKVTVENTTVPELSTEEAKTRVMLRDGQTLVIAGLIQDQLSTTNSKVPFLGDIPIFGKVFKKKENSKGKKELIIFLTPHIITVDSVVSHPAASS